MAEETNHTFPQICPAKKQSVLSLKLINISPHFSTFYNIGNYF